MGVSPLLPDDAVLEGDDDGDELVGLGLQHVDVIERGHPVAGGAAELVLADLLAGVGLQ